MTTRQYTKDAWIGLIKEHASSGLTIAEFCQNKGITTSNFYSRKRGLKIQKSINDNNSGSFSKVQVEPKTLLTQKTISSQNTQSPWRLVFPQGITLEFPSSDLSYVLSQISRGHV
jgi:hypothetical protein